MSNLPPKPERPSPKTALARRNEVEQGARNMVNQRKKTKMTAKQERNQAKQAIKNTRKNAKANVAIRREQVAANRVARNNAGRGRINQKKDDTMRQLDQYIDYCNNLRESYDAKHGEVEEATRRINGIKDRLNGLTDTILKNIRKIQELNNVSNLSNLSNHSNVNSFMGSEGRNNTDEIIAILEGIINKLPAGFREDMGRLRELKSAQERMTSEREKNHKEINSRLDAIKSRLTEINQIKGMMPKKSERRPDENARPFTVVTGKKAARARTPTEAQKRNVRLNRKSPTTDRAKNAQNQLNKRLKRSTVKLVTGKGKPLTRNDFRTKYTPGDNL